MVHHLLLERYSWEKARKIPKKRPRIMLIARLKAGRGLIGLSGMVAGKIILVFLKETICP